MSSRLAIIDTNGRAIALERQLASGGEGSVFLLSNNSSLVAKVYHRPPTPQTIEKLRTMIRAVTPQLLSLSAWPKDLLFDARSKQVVGFLMPRLVDCQPIQHLYNPVQRLKSFPRAGWNFQVRAAWNLAAAFDEVHKAGGLVGDVNQSNVQVSPQALVRLIDCDSFQIQANGKSYLCEVGVAHYIPPELQRRSLRGLIRTQNHDRFGLAVLIYQLLFVGRHPYAGRYDGPGDPSFEQLIADFRFAQGPAARTWHMAPPPYTPTFADIPPELAALFRRAFERGSEAGARPRPADWLATLTRLEDSIVVCPADPGHQYWRGASSCVWCRLADHGGPEYYFGVGAGAETFAIAEPKLQEILRRLSACGPFDFPYDRRQFASGRTPKPAPLPEDMAQNRNTARLLGAAVAICLLGVPLGLINGVIGGVLFIWAVVFAVCLAIHVSMSPWHREHRRRRTVRDQARSDVAEAEGQWRRIIADYHRKHSEASALLQRLVTECRALAPQYQAEIQRLAANAESMARLRHLRLHSIADADIAQVGAGRKQALALHGILTAADVDEARIQSVRGFGQVLTNNLLLWKESVLRQFRFDPKSGISPGEQRLIASKFQNLQRQKLANLTPLIGQLESLTPACQLALRKLTPALQRTVALYEQAEADLRLFASSSARWRL